MWNGFYNIETLTKEKLVELYTEALKVAKESRVDIKFKNSFSREKWGMLPSEYIKDWLTEEKSYNTVINRYVKQDCAEWAPVEGEIGSVYRKPDWELTTIDSYYLYLVLDLTEFNKLITKYELKRKEI